MKDEEVIEDKIDDEIGNSKLEIEKEDVGLSDDLGELNQKNY